MLVCYLQSAFIYTDFAFGELVGPVEAQDQLPNRKQTILLPHAQTCRKFWKFHDFLPIHDSRLGRVISEIEWSVLASLSFALWIAASKQMLDNEI